MISDTHGLLRPEAETALRGCHRILHAGDIGSREVLDRLAAIAPVSAVRGNVDLEPWAMELPIRARVGIGGKSFLILHDRKALRPADLAAGIDVVVSGHSHVPRIETLRGVLFVNPGSAGPRRFRLPVSMVLLEITANEVKAELIELLPAGGASA